MAHTDPVAMVYNEMPWFANFNTKWL